MVPYAESARLGRSHHRTRASGLLGDSPLRTTHLDSPSNE